MAKKNHRKTYDSISATFDNARRGATESSLFRGADSLAVTAALNPSVRKIVRERARYIVANCPYGWSMLSTFGTHVVGPWATVSFPAANVNRNVINEVVAAFDAWATKSRLWPKVQTMLRAKVTDGEAFALLTTDKTLVDDDNKVTLNLRPIECDRVESYTEIVTRENEIDGIRFDENGHPLEYRILKMHPGDYRRMKPARGGDWVKAKFVIHYFDAIRPEQVRGVSDFVSALDIPALQKSYRSAVAETAINAAATSGVLHTDAVPECYDDDGDQLGKCAVEMKPNTTFQFQRGSLVTLPEGWNLTQLRAEQPTTLYADFVRALVAEMAACLSMPVNIAMCDSSQHNFASAKLDHMTYGDRIDKERAALSVEILDRVFFAWLDEYAVVESLSPRTVAALRKTEWRFTERRGADVMKDASADNTRLGNGTTNFDIIYSGKGMDWERETDKLIDQYASILAKWKAKCKELGLDESTPCPFLAKSGAAANNPAPTEDMLEHDTQNNAATNKNAKNAAKN